ncbi:hypothetical protein FHQ18_06725 [Deferribacter autotrophicus]|uniref:Endonuclease MutS2 n=1 Tax=Deferribacter autotrophicus TaxID=500465 RepID=A0A5A8F3J0_9BACT|nr:Smr/MutS family protein [Deferribacter autotrophicus]KAA0258086.1 hypothetical protein FHQ18_06725 [Deferribacter autotrophicus]
MIDFDVLEFPLYKKLVSSEFTSVFAKKYFFNLKPFQSENSIKKVQNYIREIMNYLTGTEIELFNDSDYENFYQNLMDPYKGFSAQELVTFKIFHKWLGNLKKVLLENEAIDTLREVLKDIYSFGELIEEIDKKIADNGQVKTDATIELATIRKELNSVGKQINKTLNSIIYGKSSDSFIQDKTVVERNGRFVIPCKPNFRQFINGIVHDISKSAQTYFVEPAQIVDLNNRYQSLKIAEDEEIRKIIYELIDKVKGKRFELSSTIAAYQKLIFYIEYAKFVKNFDVVFPDIDETVEFKKIHHPIILLTKKDNSVPLDFIMEDGKKVVVISGPNTGGKTAALKSIGLNHVIAMCGLPLFGHYAKIKLFKNIMADIGDNQSLVMDLSTFSAHLMNIKNIVDLAEKSSLVLLDELGTGTEPKEGAILAVAIIEYLVKKGSKIIVTTHYKEVKEYALKNDFAENYAVDFDYKTFTPKYSLLKGVIGKSDPILIARRLNFNEEIISLALKKLQEDKTKMEYELERLNDLKVEVEILRKRLEEKEKDLQFKEEVLRKREKELEEKLSKKEEQLLEEAYYLLQKGRSILKGKMKKATLDEVEKDIKVTSKKLEKISEKKKPLEDVKVGDKIILEKYNKLAEILEVKKKSVLVNLEGIRIEIKKKDLVGKRLEDVEKEKQKAKQLSVKGEVTKSVSYELNIIGKKVDEAIDEVDKFLDKCVLAGINSAVIIHGRGTGALRKGVHQFLKNDRRVKSFRVGTFHEGGDAVTIVEF